MKAQPEQLTLFAEAFLDDLANRSHAPGSEEAKKMTVTSGLRCSELYKRQSPLGLLVRTLLGSSIWGSKIVFLTWKPKGTKSRRLLFQLVPSTPPTEGTGCGLWPTPRAQTIENKMERLTPQGRLSEDGSQRFGLNLLDAVRMWPTPRTKGMCGGTGNFEQMKKIEDAGIITETERKQMTAGNGGQLNPAWVELLMGYPLGWTDIKS